MAIKNIRPPASIPPLPSLPWNLARQPLWDYLRKMWDAFAGRPNVFGDNIPVGTPSTGTGGSSSTTGNTLAKFSSSGDVVTIVNAIPLTSTDTVPTNGSTSFLTVSGSLPSTNTALVRGINLFVVSAGSQSFAQYGLFSNLAAGYTGSSQAVTAYFINNVAGTGNNINGGGFTGNAGLQGLAVASTAGTNTGIVGYAENAGTGQAVGGTFNSRSNTGGGYAIGSISIGGNPTVNPSIAGLFSLGLNAPALESAVIIADTANTAFDGAPIFLGKRAGVTRYALDSGGNITLGIIAGSATPTSRSLAGEPGVGTNIAGATLVLIGGKATGNATGGSIEFQTSDVGASGTTLQTATTKVTIKAVGATLTVDNKTQAAAIFVANDNGTQTYSIEDGGQQNFTSDASRSQHSGTKTLTEAAATSIVTVGVPSGSVVGFVVEWTVQANDATDYQSRCGSTYVACVNKAGTLTAVVSDIGTSAFAESAGASTLTVATTAVTGTNDVSFQLNATSSLTQTTLNATYFIRKMRGTGNLTPL